MCRRKQYSNVKAFPPSTGIISQESQEVIDRLNIERLNYGRIAYSLLLNYCHGFNEKLISTLSIPETSYIDENKYFILTYNAIEQFNLLPKSDDIFKNKAIDSIFSIVNNTKTKMGERFLKNLISQFQKIFIFWKFS